jgi:polysaccharide biosynthesis/export protein
MLPRPPFSCWVTVFALLFSTLARAADSSNESAKSESRQDSSATSVTTDPNYRLGAGDTVWFSVWGQQDLDASQTISRSGDVRLPLIKEDVVLAGKTVRQAERDLEKLYRDKELLKKPVVSLKVSSYFPRTVSVLGAVNRPGTVPFPPDTVSLDIVEVITRVDGFKQIAKPDSVTVTRRAADGKETVHTLDLRGIISGSRKAGRDRVEFLIYPGDRIFVPESWY